MAETDFKYDVFISYSSANKDWVRKDLLNALEKAGLKACIDFRDFKPGKPSIKNIRDSILERRHTLLVMTEPYLKSGWTDFENMLSQTIDPANRDGRIIPLLKEKCDLPLEIKYLTYINFADSDDLDMEWKKLFESLGATHEPKSENPTRNDWHLTHPYPMPPNFTGRAAEQKMLDEWLVDDKDRLFILRALGGFGKSALAWQWINTHVNPAEYSKLVFWSFYEGDASFEHFIEETLRYLKLEVPQGGRLQVDELLKAMQSQKILLIMDGFERALRAYSSMNAAYQGDEEPKLEDNQLDCVNINAEFFLKGLCSLPNIKSKVLITTRLTPRAVKPRGECLQGCREVELTAMQPADAVEFFHKQKIKGTHAEIEAACAPYGYHPLSLRILAGLIIDDRKTPGDISVANKLEITDDIIQNKHHVLEVGYNSLTLQQQNLLSTIACFRSPVNYDVLKEISVKRLGKSKKSKAVSIEKLDDNLKTLETRGLLHWDRKTNKYDLHPIVRRYSYERLTTPQRTGAHVVLVVYFEAIPQPPKIEKLEDLAPVIELYHHMVRAGKLDDACDLYYDRIADPIYFQLGAYQSEIELLSGLFFDGKDKRPRLKNVEDQAWTLNSLATSYAISGQPSRAIPLFEMHITLLEETGSKDNLIRGLSNMATQQFCVGTSRAAESNLRRGIDLCSKTEEENQEAEGWCHQNLGSLLSYRGVWQEAEQELDSGLKLFEKQNTIQSQDVIWSYRALHFLLMARANPKSSIQNLKSSIASASRALELADEFSRNNFRVERDYIRAYWLLGAAYRVDGGFAEAEESLSKAISMWRQINMVDYEADILLDLARLRYDQKNYEEAKSLVEEALLITERCGYVLQGADVNLFLAQYALEQEQDKVKAKEYAEEAKKLATCDGPPYYYKVAYEEAERFLEQLAG